MRILPLRRSAKTLRAKLFVNMLVLTIVLLFVIFAGLFFIGSIDVVQVDLHKTLDLQIEVFERELNRDFENLAIMSMQLSRDMTAIIEDRITPGKTIDELSGDELTELQDAMFEPVTQKLLQSDCSGVFVLLDTTVNHDVSSAEYSRNGLYLSRNTFATPYNSSVLLYGGDPQIGREHKVMPHRKWRLEFDVSLFPNYNELMRAENASLEDSFRITDLFTLPGTSEEAILLTVPLIGEDGTIYGLCGFELSQSYFKWRYAQPTELDRLLCLLAAENDGVINMANSLSCGTLSGYYLDPGDTLSHNEAKSGLSVFEGEQNYVGILKDAKLPGQNENMILAVMIPKADYDNRVAHSTARITIFVILLLFFGVICCLFFSHKFLSPITSALKKLKEENRVHAKIKISEIDDLFDFLAQKDSEHEAQMRSLADEKQKIATEYAKAQTNLARLVDKKTDEIDDESLEAFLTNLSTLTKREREVFDLYLEGKKAKEIHELLDVSESTIKFHNKNIYDKLGVFSRKQLLQYATLMKEREGRKK